MQTSPEQNTPPHKKNEYPLPRVDRHTSFRCLPENSRINGNSRVHLNQHNRWLDLCVDRLLFGHIDRLDTAFQHFEKITKTEIQPTKAQHQLL